MKKTVKIFGLCALLTIATLSCKKNNEFGEVIRMTFKASVTQPTSDDKTYLDGESPRNIRWYAGDQVKVFVKNGHSALFTTQDEGEINASFTGSIETSDRYVAFYPAANITDDNNGFVTMDFCGRQPYVKNGIANGMYPMAALESNFNFQFHSPCGFLHLCLKCNSSCTIDSIVLDDKDEIQVLPYFGEKRIPHPLVGKLVAEVATIDPADPVFELPKDFREETITLVCNPAVQLGTEYEDFFFVVPTYPKYKVPVNIKQVFYNGFTAKVYGNGGNLLKTIATPDGSVDVYTMESEKIKKVSSTIKL